LTHAAQHCWSMNKQLPTKSCNDERQTVWSYQ
jgi:hypothetical protein